MKTKTLEEVISDLKAQCDSKASAVADLLEGMRYNVEAKDFTLLDCADEVADMGEWGNYAAERLRGKKTEVKSSPSASELAAKGFKNIKINSAKAAAKTARLAKTEKPEGLVDIVRGMNNHAAKKEHERGKKGGIKEMTEGLSPSAKKIVIDATNRLLPAGRCNNCMTYFPADKWEEMQECPHCKTDNYLMDMPGLAASTEMFDILVEVEAHSRMRRPIKKATWLKVCEVLKKVDGVHR